jgi:hypothetical protein
MAQRLAQLAEVRTEPAVRSCGRVITVVLRSPDDERPFDLLQYIRPWWTTVNRVGLRATVLYSGLSQADVRAATTQHVGFVEVAPGARHVFHERHFLVREHLRTISEPAVFITDASDVSFKRDPFSLALAAGEGRRLFIGREKRRIATCKCIRREMRRQFGRVYFPWRPVLNPGIFGGRIETVLEALDAITRVIEEWGDRLTGSDMCLVNRAVYETFRPEEIVTGLPLHSRFKGWEFDTSAAILHK